VIVFRNPRPLFALALVTLAILRAGSWQLQAQAPADDQARDQINRGVAAYKAAHYDEAIADFQKATELDPTSNIAHVYLATALAQNVVPGLDTPDNQKLAERAINLFKQVLDQNPHDVNSLKQVAGIYWSVKNFDEAKAWQLKVLAEEPNDPEAAYTIGVIDWTLAHQNTQAVLQPAGLQDDGVGNAKAPQSVLEKISQQNRALVDEGVQYLSQAIADRPNYSDAMSYLNLMYRRKADVDWDNDPARTDDLNRAEEWRQKAMQVRKSAEDQPSLSPNSPQP
jgi:tetratricopeptide (TPR) repeat protein